MAMMHFKEVSFSSGFKLPIWFWVVVRIYLAFSAKEIDLVASPFVER